MALNVPTIQDSADQNRATLEGSLGQTSPLNSKAFLRVLAVMEAMAMAALYRYGADRAKQTLALTAGEDGLIVLGDEYQVPRKAAAAAKLTATLPTAAGVIIPAATAFVGDLNGVTYRVDTAVESGGVATLSLTAEVAGAQGNLSEDATLSIVSGIPGATNVATVTEVTTVGAEQETLSDWADRIHFAERATQGGGNGTDYKTWGEAVAGVLRCFPYAGKPFGTVGTSYPGDRTVYIQAASSIDPDGVPPQALLDEVRAALNINPATGFSRPTLGLIDETLYVEPVYRTAFVVNVVGLVVPSGATAAVKASISSALSTYFAGLKPYVLGVDLPHEQNDTITAPLVNRVVQDVLTATGASASGVQLKRAGVVTATYSLSPGELAKLSSVQYDGV